MAFIFQLGTNNWQRAKKDGSGELEFAPGSGVLHEAHHNAYNIMPGTKCYSMYPSQNQGQPTDPNADYAVFELDHPIPICESASPNSSKRWHGMSEEEFTVYVTRMEKEVYDYMKKCEAKEGRTFNMAIAHHSFVNPLVLRNVIQKRKKEGIPQCPLYCFVHGTALKMYRWELGPKETDEQKSFPMRFHSMMLKEKIFDDQVNGISACFVISAEQKGGIKEIFPQFPQDRVIVAPNGINVEKFKPREKTLTQVLVEQTRTILWPAVPSEEDCGKYGKLITFVGKAAEWKRQAALLKAMASLEKEFPDLACLCVGTGPEAELDKLKKQCEDLGLKNTFLLGARGQDILAEIYTVAKLGIFPSFREPFGLVFVECMACRTPVIGANSGGPKDFVTPSVGELVAEPPETKDLSTVTLGIDTLGATLTEAIGRALKEDWKASKADACIKLAHDKFTVGAQVKAMLEDAAKVPPPLKGEFIFQLGTNNWQRAKKDGSGELEFAPGSGVLHEAHHNAYNIMPGTKCYSMYPSENQGQPTDPNADYAVFELDHPIPICESASPNSSKRWHGMSEAEFTSYVTRLENDVYEYMKKCEAKEGKTFTMAIAHHSFVNPLVLRNVIQKRKKEGVAQCPLYCFVHGTALKMYRWELGPKETDEQKSFPMRFHKMMLEEKIFEDQVNGISACFVISAEQKGGIKEIFPMFPQDRVIVSPNGINVEKFKPREKTLTQVIVEQTRTILWPAVPSEADCAKYTKLITFVGKAAEWKRQAALLNAMANLEKEFPELVCLCVGTGPEAELNKLKTLCEELGLKNTFLLGARGQDILAEIYTVAQLGIFPSFREPFGLVFVECMACKTPVIGANSGGPKDFVAPEVGELVAEPPETTDLNTVPLGIKTLGATLTKAIGRALKEDWKTSKAEACIKLAHDKFTVGAQVKAMLQDAAKLPAAVAPPPAASSGVFKVVFLRHGESDWNVKNIFTGWHDVDLSDAGKLEALDAGKMLKDAGFKFDIVFTSVLRRAIRTAWTALMESDNFSMPVINTWRLNERHYGGLQGLNKAETAAKHGDAQVKIWRRSYDVPPPTLDISDPRHPANDPLYKNVPASALPGAESLKLTVDRVLPFWFDAIAPCIMAGRSVMVAAHGNSLRAICKYLENMSEDQVLEFNIPTGVPLVYELDAQLKFVKRYYLLDPEEVAKKVAAVANQGKAK
jgi:bisphosphoglycerate-dependent phosphoglycerate mutase family 1